MMAIGHCPSFSDQKMTQDEWNNYELIDFGEGRKLERWGDLLIDRPSPAAESAKRSHPRQWSQAHGYFEKKYGGRGAWKWKRRIADSWNLRFGSVTVAVGPTPFGHLGLFPEQQGNWKWILRQHEASQSPLRVLNLFAYTGASTLFASRTRSKASPQEEAASDVVHVDASKSSVAKARRNATLSQLEHHPVRWIVDDVLKFCKREIKRGRRYDAIILDPPTYGHGPKGERWEIENHLEELLDCCRHLWSGDRGYFLLTCHSDSIDASMMKQMAASFFQKPQMPTASATVESGPMNLITRDQRLLNSGVFARWTLEASIS